MFSIRLIETRVVFEFTILAPLGNLKYRLIETRVVFEYGNPIASVRPTT